MTSLLQRRLIKIPNDGLHLSRLQPFAFHSQTVRFVGLCSLSQDSHKENKCEQRQLGILVGTFQSNSKNNGNKHEVLFEILRQLKW